MSLRRRIMVLAAIGMVAATAPLGLMGVGMLRAATERVLAERLALTRVTAEHLDGRLSRSRDHLVVLARLVAAARARGRLGEMRPVLAAITLESTVFTGGVLLTDAAGELVFQEPGTDALALSRQDLRPVIHQTLSTGRPAVSTLLRTAGSLPVVVMTVPVPGPGPRPAGVLAGVINLADPALQTFVEGMAVGTTGHAVVVDADGVVLMSTDRTELFTRGEHPEFFIRHMRARKAAVGPTEDREGHAMAFVPLTTVPWGVAAGQDEEETFGPIRRLRDRIVLFGLAVLAAALLFAWVDTGAVAAPLRLLQENAERIARGDLGRPVDVQRGDEIGALARSFETMRVRLLASLEEIQRRAVASQALYEVGTEVLSLRDRDAVLRSVAARAASLLRADVAVVCLFAGRGDRAVVRAASGPAAGAVARGSTFPVPAGDLQQGCVTCANIDAALRSSHLAVPLTVGRRTVGALCVASSTPRTFSPEDREILNGLANLAAIAVENARLQGQVRSLAVAEERERIARELHDSVGQVLGYVNTKVQAVKLLLEAGKLPEALAQLGQLEDAARTSYADLREAILGLRTEISPHCRLVDALREYVSRFSELSGVETRLLVEGDPAAYLVDPPVELHLIRIVQEALANVRKHARARRAWVWLVERGGTLMVSVSDDGVGFDPARVGGGLWPRFGLQTMRERAEAIGGSFAVRRRDGGGTVVSVSLPVHRGGPVDARAAGG
ncbi:MAG: histidine kinase [Armatimonadota bacterium]|nr:histidine kinase [Armatimonadota bacterium]MDR7592907.1 histidine kinase [Armatimonadota bacterium]